MYTTLKSKRRIGNNEELVLSMGEFALLKDKIEGTIFLVHYCCIKHCVDDPNMGSIVDIKNTRCTSNKNCKIPSDIRDKAKFIGKMMSI